MTLLIQPVFGLETHNGTITVSNPATGQHRTFRVRTQKPDARFAPGTATTPTRRVTAGWKSLVATRAPDSGQQREAARRQLSFGQKPVGSNEGASHG